MQGIFSTDLTLADVKSLRAVQPRPFRDQSHNGLYQVLASDIRAEDQALIIACIIYMKCEPAQQPCSIRKHIKSCLLPLSCLPDGQSALGSSS